MTDLGAEASVTIDAPVESVWRALTTPELIKQWFFGVDTETDWTVGGPLVHRGVYQGKAYVDKGRIIRFDPPRTLVHTHWSDISGKPDMPENYQQVTWALSDKDGKALLEVTEENIPSPEAQAVSEQGWQTVLANLKGLLED